MTVLLGLLSQEPQGRRRPADGRRRAHDLDLVVFVLLLLVLRKFAWPVILGAVEAREKALEAQLAEAEQNRAEVGRAAGGAQEAAGRRPEPGPGDAGRGQGVAEKERAAAMEKAGRNRPSCWSGPGATSRRSGTAPSRSSGARRWTCRSPPPPADRPAARQRDRPEAGA